MTVHMKKKNFKLMVVGEDGTFKEVSSTDYDTDLQLVRYKDVLYDIPTGLWVVTLKQMQKDFSYWKGCGKFPDTRFGDMLDLVRSNGIFKHRLEKQRQKVLENKLAEVVNEVECDLFSLL